MRYRYWLLLMSVLPLSIHAQTRTIYNKLGMKEGGELTRNSPLEPDYSSIMGIPASTSVRSRNELTNLMLQTKELFKTPSRFAANYSIPILDTLQLADGNFLYSENGKYGLKSAGGAILTAPKYDFVEKKEKGFVGYQSDTCNYFDNTGKALLSRYYYSITPTSKSTFIIQNNKGFGVLDAANKTIIEPVFYNIEPLEQQGQLFYKISPEAKKYYYVSQNVKDTIWINDEGSFLKIIDSEYWTLGGRIINIKTKRELTSEKEVYIEIIDEKKQLANLSWKDGRYLINFKGQIIVDQVFGTIGQFNESGYAVASVKDQGGTEKWGVINRNGSWVVPAKYYRTSFINNQVVQVINEERLGGTIRLKDGKTLLSNKYTDIRTLDDKLGYAVLKDANRYKIDVFTLKDSKIIRNVPFRSLSKLRICGGKGFIASNEAGETLLNENFEPLTKRAYSRIFYGPADNSILATDFRGDTVMTQWMSCSGKIQTLKVNGKESDVFNSLIKIDEGFYYVKTLENRGYFILRDGTTVPADNSLESIERADFQDYYIMVADNGKYGLINSEGKTIMPLEFVHIGKFNRMTGLASYSFDGEHYGYFTTTGELLFGGKYDKTGSLGLGVFKVENNGYKTVLNRSNTRVTGYTYSIIELVGGLIKVESDKFSIIGKRIR
ncbi:hypothetical protein DVR12_07835 [Chitinophaga silvatica]|uniref:WG repeat-containing protein n=1 Tax=Chitinophaga silvatica TaxID=2282649 RepID=A0A3E1YEX4_9BACT|nr:WG repeat-containing protein [Chitinophaga silvatica]RFS25085.1 hypothetical protein DVR12_07835 [Chitinophaga silvatica]